MCHTPGCIGVGCQCSSTWPIQCRSSVRHFQPGCPRSRKRLQHRKAPAAHTANVGVGGTLKPTAAGLSDGTCYMQETHGLRAAAGKSRTERAIVLPGARYQISLGELVSSRCKGCVPLSYLCCVAVSVICGLVGFAELVAVMLRSKLVLQGFRTVLACYGSAINFQESNCRCEEKTRSDVPKENEMRSRLACCSLQ